MGLAHELHEVFAGDRLSGRNFSLAGRDYPGAVYLSEVLSDLDVVEWLAPCADYRVLVFVDGSSVLLCLSSGRLVDPRAEGE